MAGRSIPAYPRAHNNSAQRITARAADVGVADAFAELGISQKQGWVAAGWLYLVAGLSQILLIVMLPSVAPPASVVVAATSIAFAAICVLGSRVATEATWGSYFRTISAWIVYVAAAVALGSLHKSLIWIPVITLTVTASIYGMRRGVPFSIGGLALVAATALTSPTDYALTVVMFVVASMFVVALFMFQYQIRGLAREHERLAGTDELTGVANMRSLRRMLTDELGHSGEGRPFALFAIDLDEFKRVNDQFDHGMGDRVLQAVAAELVNSTGDETLVARRGGDEFSVVVPQQEACDLEQLRARLHDAIARARKSVCPQVTPSGSVGFARSRPGDELGSILRRADDALHGAKLNFRAGRKLIDERQVRPESVFGDGNDQETCDADERPDESAASVAPVRLITDEPSGGFMPVRVNSDESKLVCWIAAMLFGVSATLIGGFTATGTAAPMPVAAGIAVAAVLAGLGVVCGPWHERRRSPQTIKFAFVTALALVAFTALFAASGSKELVNLVPLFAVVGFLMFAPRFATSILLICLSVTVVFAFANTNPGVLIWSISTSFTVLASASLTLKVRSVTDHFVRANLELSELDALTAVGNLRALRARLEDVFARREQRAPVSIIAVDLDEFKQCNEVYSHTVGDAVLTATARALSESARIDDLVARRGGDEFFVITDGAEPHETAAIAARMSAAVAAARSRLCPDLRASISIATVSLMPGDDAESFYTRADQALHESKAVTHRRRRQVGTRQSQPLKLWC